MYDSAYQSEPDEVLPYLETHKDFCTQRKFPSQIVRLQVWHVPDKQS